MRAISESSVVLQHGKLRLVRRSDTKNWQVHFKVDGVKQWFRKTLETDDLEKASGLAHRMWMKATFDHEDGRPIISKRFAKIANIVLQRLTDEVKAKTAKPSFKDYIAALKLYLIPFYGNYNVDGIKPAVIDAFHGWRREKLGREISASAQGNHNVAMNLVFDEAIQRGYMTEMQRPSLRNTGSNSDRRAEFSHDELETIIAALPHFIKHSRAGRTREIREMMAIYVPFMAATGMRPGTEAEYLEWRHIDVEVRDKQPILHFRIQKGKRGARNFVAHNSCWLLLERLRQMNPELAKTPLQKLLRMRMPRRLFCLADGTMPETFNKSFRALLEELNLLKCPVTGKERSLYSLRHYYATQRLLENIPIVDLAQQMGTSVLMITKHYSHLTPLMKAKQFAGDIDDSGSTQDTEHIRALMNAQMAAKNIMSLVEASTGMSFSIQKMAPEFAEDLAHRLHERLKTVQ